MTRIAVRQRTWLGDPRIDVVALASTAAACASSWGLPAPSVVSYRLRKPRGSWRVSFSRRMPSGAAGYHDQTRGTPYSLCDPDYGEGVVAHELLEMLVDPYGVRFEQGASLRTGKDCSYLVEVCDPVEETDDAYVTPGFYANPKLDAGGYISWVEDGSWWQAFADVNGNLSFQNLGAATFHTRDYRNYLSGKDPH